MTSDIGARPPSGRPGRARPPRGPSGSARPPGKWSGSAHPEASLARGAAVISIATGISRLTGFLRVVVVASALGTTYLANTYQTANTAPNLVFELMAAGVLTSVFVPAFVEHLVTGQRGDGWRAANALTSVAVVALSLLAGLLALGAPAVMRLLTIGVEDPSLRAREVELGTVWLRLFAPQVVLYGAGMIMTAALHAHRRFALAAVAPIFNNVVVICVYLTYAAMRAGDPPTLGGITNAQVLVLGAGTSLGVVAMTVCLVPGLHRLGWSWRWRFEPSHPAVVKAARLGIWALSYAGGYQAGLVVVLMLGNRVEGGVAAYQWAYTFFYVPHAVVAVPIGSVLFPAISEHAARGDIAAFVARVRDGLGMLAFVLVPAAGLAVVLAVPVAALALHYGAMSEAGAVLVGRTFASFSVGLPGYSAFVMLTRAFYALADTRTPALVNAVAVGIASAAGAFLFFTLPPAWSVPGLALGHSLGFWVGALLLTHLLGLRTRASHRGGPWPVTRRALGVGGAATLAAAVMHAVLPAASTATLALNAVATTAACAGLYVAVMSRLDAPEMARLVRLGRGRIGWRAAS
jgi:putative peptidoglycan lipid II flippase